MTSDTVNVKYILGILNSKIGRYIAKQYVSQLQTRQFRMLSQFVNKFPIAKATNQQTSEVITMIESILEAKGDSKNINKYQQLINKETYEIYGLTKREIEFLENQSTE